LNYQHQQGPFHRHYVNKNVRNSRHSKSQKERSIKASLSHHCQSKTYKWLQIQFTI